MSPRETVIFIVVSIVIFLVVIIVSTFVGQLSIEANSPTQIIDLIKSAIALLGGFLIKLAYDIIKGRDRLRSAKALVLEEMRQALRTCDDKIAEWKARIQNASITVLADDGSPLQVHLYPTIATFAFESVASELTRLPSDQRDSVFSAYYYILRRRESSARQLHVSQLIQHGREAIEEIERLQRSIEYSIRLLTN